MFEPAAYSARVGQLRSRNSMISGIRSRATGLSSAVSNPWRALSITISRCGTPRSARACAIRSDWSTGTHASSSPWINSMGGCTGGHMLEG